nr:MAG TPA: hypothetical protein [Caudoviricetes sp.]
MIFSNVENIVKSTFLRLTKNILEKSIEKC